MDGEFKRRNNKEETKMDRRRVLSLQMRLSMRPNVGYKCQMNKILHVMMKQEKMKNADIRQTYRVV